MLWFRNTWRLQSADGASIPSLRLETANVVRAEHDTLGTYQFAFDAEAEVLFTENETNAHRLRGVLNPTPFVKDAFHDYVVAGRRDAVNGEHVGTKCAPQKPEIVR